MCNIKTVQDMYQYIEIPSAREQLLEGSVPIRAIQYCHNTSPYTPLERLFPCSHTCFTCERWHTLYVNEGIAIARGVYFLLDHTCTPPRMLHVWTLIDKKKENNYLKYCIYMYFGGQQTFPKYKRYSYVRPLNTRSMVSLSFIGLWHGRGGISYPHCYHPAYPSPQEHHVNVCPPQYRTSNKHNSNT